MKKIAIFGAGNVGASAALQLAIHELCHEIVLVDVHDNIAAGVALDIQHAGPLQGFDTRIHGSTDPANIANADIVIIAAGAPRQPGMSRSDLLDINLQTQLGIIEQIIHHAPNSIILQVTNPADILTYSASRITQWPRNRVLGLSGVLDSARMAAFIAEEASCSVRNVTAMVIGGHGDTMVPLTNYSYINGITITEFLSEASIQRISARTCKAGTEILKHKKQGTASIAPGAAIAIMVDAIANDRKCILPTIAILKREYQQADVAMCVPCQIGRKGVEQIVELPLTEIERELLNLSIKHIRDDLAQLSVA
ncbi:MAG: malate dehydrogenase [Gammaproteobacteria bacterium]|nr:malate dehydrogenase [Gammaproteobacteria bacterium]